MIHCIGDSHSAVFSGEEKMQPCWPDPASNITPYFKSYRIGPATAYQLHTKQPIIESLIQTLNLKNEDSVMFCFGEVDIRAHLIKQSKLQNRSIEDIVDECVTRYVNAVKYYAKYTSKILFWGPIASWNSDRPYTGPSHGTNQERNMVAKIFNEKLEQQSKINNFKFITIFYEMLNDDMSTNSYYLDDWDGSHMHLSQRSMPTILQKFKEKDLIK